jgi:imidazolonepropionase-like amidohydrolase
VRFSTTACLVALLALPAGGQQATAFTGVNVLPMDVERELPGHTVVVEQGRITALGRDGAVAIPEGARVVDGSGAWLMPGLIDAHTHERALPDWPDDVAGNLVMSLANGVTTIVNMGDVTGAVVGVRDAVRSGTLPGPSIVVGHFVRGPGDGGAPHVLVSGADDARALVARARAQGYDFLKVYSAVPSAAWAALAPAARAVGLAIGGHLMQPVGLEPALAAGQVLVSHSASFPLPANDPSTAVRLALTHGTVVDPTLFVQELIVGFGLDALASRPSGERFREQQGVEYMDDAMLAAWDRMMAFRTDIRTPVDRRAAFTAQQVLVKAMDDAGVPLVLGTDTLGIPGVVPGFAIHGELRARREAGIAPWRALLAGTRTAGEYLRRHVGLPEVVGVVEVGARADLLLLDADPRLDPDTLRRPRAVMAAGRYYPREWLQAELERLRSR